MVSNICDIFSFDVKKMLENTNTFQQINQKYSRGIISYQDKMVTIVDLKEMFKITDVTNNED
ncbi:MAG: hypothetical protein QNJ42_01230 [Crocosphaera sp.]|nr:hypothetical protein [Crocosphaera sp.]